MPIFDSFIRYLHIYSFAPKTFSSQDKPLSKHNHKTFAVAGGSAGLGKVYAVVNQKGGVGKTTTAINVAAALAGAGKQVLLVDLDPQGNATSGLGIDKQAIGTPGSPIKTSVYDILINDASVCETVTTTSVEGLFILPANLDLAGAEVELIPRLARETVLRTALSEIRDCYDYVFIDAPPSLGILTINALVAADAAMVPIQCEYYALEGVSQLVKTINLVKRQLNPGLEIGLVVMTMYDNRVKLNQQVVEEVRGFFGERVSQTLVPRNVRIAEAPSHGMPVTAYDRRSRGAQAYREIAREVTQLA
jgi:chromosome partitioning protein